MSFSSLYLTSLSPFTLYDEAEKAEISSKKMEAVGGRCRRMLRLIVPLTLYTIYLDSKQVDELIVDRCHGYTTHKTIVTWGMCLSFTIEVLLEWLQREDMIEKLFDLFGPIGVSLIYYIPINSGYIFYFAATMEETSAVHALLQISLLLMFEIIPSVQCCRDLCKNTVNSTVKRMMEMYDCRLILMMKKLHIRRSTHADSTEV